MEKEVKIFETEDAQKAKEIKAQKTADGFDNFLSRVGLNNDNALSAGTYVFNLITRNRVLLEAAYRGSWIVGKIVDCFAEDMTRAGINVTTNEDESDLKDLMSAITKLQISQSLCDAIKWSRLYGGALGVLQIEGQDMKTQLDISTIAEGQFKGVAVYDRWQLNPVMLDVITSGPDMGLPSTYQIVNNLTSALPSAPTMTGQITVHHSRVVRLTGIKLPFFQAITEMMWGESVLERLWDRLVAFDEVTMSAASLVDQAKLRTVGIEGLREILAAGGPAQLALEAQFDMMRRQQTNLGLTLIDKNDEYKSDNYSFSGLSDMMVQFSQQMSGSCDTPLVRLFGQSPAGLNSTGESDIRTYYDSVKAQQEARLRSGWDLILRVMWMSTFGKPAPKDMEFEFVPLWQMSAIDKANIAKTNTETIIGAHESTLIDTPTAMKELREISGETGVFNNITDESIEEAENDPAPMPGEVDPSGNSISNEGEKPEVKIEKPLPSLGSEA